jgi:hypothetical protein
MTRFLFLCILLFIPASFPLALDQELTTLFSDLIKNDPAQGAKVIAIMPFKTAGQGVTKEAGRSVAEFGVVLFQGSGRYKVVERADLLKAVSEITLAQSGLMNDSAGLQVGKMLSADRLLLGTIADIFGKRMISARIVKTETGEVLSSASVTVASRDLDKFAKDLLSEKGQISATLFRSALIPGWGQFYNGHPVQGGVSLAAFACAAVYFVYCLTGTAAALDESNLYVSYLKTPQWGQDVTDTLQILAGTGVDITDTTVRQSLARAYTGRQDALYQAYTDKFNQMVVAFLIGGGVWALNLADAAILGSQAKKKFNLYFSRTPREAAHVEFAYSF